MNASSTPVRDTGGRTDRSPPDQAADRKATLFCPDCGYDGSLDGGWETRTAGDRRRIRCPECHHVVDDRRVDDARPVEVHGPTADAPAPSPVRRCIDVWNRYWSTWTALVTGRAADDY